VTTYLVTGGTGNFGSFVTKQLLGADNAVVAYDMLPNRGALEVLLTPDELGRTTIVQGDVVDLERLIRTLRSHRVQLITHLAAVGVDACRDNPAQSVRTNVVGTNNVFEAALAAGVTRVLFTSSGSVFGAKSVSADGVLAHDAPFDPTTIYGATKVVNEVVARTYSEHYGLDTIGVRPTGSGYGPVPGGMLVRWIPELIRGLVRGERGTAMGGDAVHRWHYAEDVARAIVAALHHEPCSNRTLTIPAGFPASNDEVIGHIREALPDASITVVPAPAQHAQPSITDQAREPGPPKELRDWKLTIGVREGIDRIIEFYRAAPGLPR
jgi:nucleoside-diphosphate-sugar epimerase